MRDLRVRSAAAGVAAALLFLATGAMGAAGDAESSPETRLVGVVNINTASAEQLELLPGVGPVRAAEIISHRKSRDGFKRVEELVDVSGIGPVALERIRPHVTVSGKTTAKLLR